MSEQGTVQRVASIAAAAIAASATNAQAAEGRARQAIAVAKDTGGGIFEALLAQILPGPQAPAGPSQDEAAAQLSNQVSQQSVSAASAINATASSGRTTELKNTWLASSAQQLSSPQSVPATTATQPANWQAALSPALARQEQQGAGIASASMAQPPSWQAALSSALARQAQHVGSTAPTITSPSAAALMQSLPAQTASPAQGNAAQNAPKTGTANPNAVPLSNADIMAALQSLAAQQPTSIVAQQQPAASSNSDFAVLKASNPGLASLLQVLKEAQAGTIAPSGQNASQPGAPTAQNSAPTTSNAAQAAPNTAQALVASFAKAPFVVQAQIPAGSQPAAVSDTQHAQFTQATHNALHEGATAPVTEAQALPLHFTLDSGNGNGSSNGQSSGQSSSHDTTPTTSSTSSNSAANANAPTGSTIQPAAQPAHDVSPPSAQPALQNAPAPSSANSAVAAATASPAQATTASLQIGPAGQGSAQGAAVDVHAVAVNIATQFQSGTKQFDIRLDPPELGRVDVRLTVDPTGKAQAHLAVDKPQTLELLQRDSGTLARALKDSGVQLNNNGLQFSLKGQGRQNGASQRPQSRSRALSVSAVTSASQSAGGLSSSMFSGSRPGVDIRV